MWLLIHFKRDFHSHFTSNQIIFIANLLRYNLSPKLSNCWQPLLVPKFSPPATNFVAFKFAVLPFRRFDPKNLHLRRSQRHCLCPRLFSRNQIAISHWHFEYTQKKTTTCLQRQQDHYVQEHPLKTIMVRFARKLYRKFCVWATEASMVWRLTNVVWY